MTIANLRAGEELNVCVHYVRASHYGKQPLTMRARANEYASNMLISRDLASQLGVDPTTGSFQSPWYEAGTSTSHQGTFYVSEELDCDVVISGENFGDLDRGRHESISAVDFCCRFLLGLNRRSASDCARSRKTALEPQVNGRTRPISTTSQL